MSERRRHAGDLSRRGWPARLAQLVAVYALVGVLVSAVTVLSASPFEESDPHPSVPFSQRSARAWVRDVVPGHPDFEPMRYVAIVGWYRVSSPEQIGMPVRLESMLLAQPDGRYEVWWSGFPFRSVCGWHVKAGSLFDGGPPTDVWHGIIRIPMAAPARDIFIPIRPLWWGLIGNVAVYGLSAFLLVWLFTRVRRALRRQRGRCVGCGYELAGLEACPECGLAGQAHGSRPVPVAP